MIDALRQDLRFALHSTRTRPRFAILAVVTLGLGIGASTAMFSVVDQVLLKAVPFREPGELVKVWAVDSGMREYGGWNDLCDHLGLSPSQFRRLEVGADRGHPISQRTAPPVPTGNRAFDNAV